MTTRMKLCQVVPSLEERHGGPSKSVHNLSAALAEAGHEVKLLATVAGPGASERVGRLEIDTFHRDWPQRLAPSRGLRDRLRQVDAAVVHHHALWLRTLHYAHRAAVRSHAVLVVSPRGMMSAWAWRHHRWRKRLSRFLVHPGALAAVRGWHATSEDEAAEIRALGYAQPICIAPNGVSIPTPEQMERSAEHWHEACPEAGERPVALFYSRFHLKKRVIELIDVWLEHGPRDWLLLLVGIPQDYTPAMLEEYALRMGGPGRIRAFTGAGRPPPYAAASLFLLPSHNENFGLVVAEALAHGVPALVTDTMPWRALNANGGGWCVPWADYPAALRAAVAEAPAKLRARGATARAWVAREYAWEKPARALADFYRDLAGSQEGNP
jgi:glycosyltransferase involved in cell wall biosynthesis